ncbi:MAG: PAS domain-containing sensor histidine kinase [Lachnospiraceae bacterium]|nr:PAS domain-containing sensor histidine kinase [Lachnospiraceae bacterium]
MKLKKVVIKIGFTILMLVISFLISLFVVELTEMYSVVPALFTLAVFIIALATRDYIYGIVSSFVSVLALNFAFTFPYFKFNFSIPENLVSGVIMLTITTLSSTLTIKIKQQESLRAETEKEKMRANLLRAVSHDLRTPLTTIYGSSSAIVENKELTKEQVWKLAEGIKVDAQWLMGMVENLLSVTKIDNGNVKLIKTPVVLEELVDSVLLRFRKRYPKQSVEVQLPDEFVIIPMDAVLIEQVMVNLLENAVQHAHGMTELRLEVYTKDNNAVFEIHDNGCGIPKERLANLFTGYFVSEDAPADCQKRNMGIGLSVCASIIKAHDGEIMAENKKEGGCVFRFALEMEKDEYEQ